MATLKNYFESDLKTFSYSKTFSVHLQKPNDKFDIIGRLHLDFEANAAYISYYIQRVEMLQCPSLFALSKLEEILALQQEVHAEVQLPGQEKFKISNLNFTGRIIIYDENDQCSIYDDEVKRQAKERGHDIQFRRSNYAIERTAANKPLAFISHDSRDKELIVKPIVHELFNLSCHVWYDEYSLNIGDSLRESIEKGIKETKKCILIITPHFINNSGWTKAEFDSVFTKDILMNTKSILPIWHNVTKEEVFEYCPTLLNTLALIWPSEDDVNYFERKKSIINKLRNAII